MFLICHERKKKNRASSHLLSALLVSGHLQGLLELEVGSFQFVKELYFFLFLALEQRVKGDRRQRQETCVQYQRYEHEVYYIK